MFSRNCNWESFRRVPVKYGAEKRSESGAFTSANYETSFFVNPIRKKTEKKWLLAIRNAPRVGAFRIASNASDPGDVLDDAAFKTALADIFAQESGAFEGQTASLTRFQFKTLVAVARHGGRNVFSREFLNRSELPSAATASRALGALSAKGLLFLHLGEYKFFNPFLRAWLLSKGY